jgi:hypothetical protein
MKTKEKIFIKAGILKLNVNQGKSSIFNYISLNKKRTGIKSGSLSIYHISKKCFGYNF